MPQDRARGQDAACNKVVTYRRIMTLESGIQAKDVGASLGELMVCALFPGLPLRRRGTPTLVLLLKSSASQRQADVPQCPHLREPRESFYPPGIPERFSKSKKDGRAAMEANGTIQLLALPPTTCVYREDFKRWLLPPVYSVVLAAGLPLNMCVIAQICASRRALTRSAVYTLNLALADLLYACSLPLLIYNYAQGDHWPFGDLTCRLVRFLFYANLHGSILFLTCISFQRYLGICHPLAPWHKRGGRRAAWLVCGAVWLAVTAQCLPTAIFAATGTQRNRTVCYDLSPPVLATRYLPYGMALTVIGFVLPFAALLACYYRLARRLCRQDGPAGPVAQERRSKAARMAVVVAAVFAISFLPFHVTKTAYLAVRSTPGVSCPVLEAFAAAYKGTRPFASANSVLDPILFYFTQRKFRRQPHELLQKLTAKWQRQGR